MDRGAGWATVHGVAKSWTWLSMHACTFSLNTHKVFKDLFICILALLSFRCYVRAFSSCGVQALACRFSRCGTQG